MVQILNSKKLQIMQFLQYNFLLEHRIPSHFVKWEFTKINENLKRTLPTFMCISAVSYMHFTELQLMELCCPQ